MGDSTGVKPAEEQIHRLLRRQIKRYLGDPDALPQQWQSMLTAVNEAYAQFESDYAMLERSLELSSQELREANSGMRAVYERLIKSSMDGIFAFDHQSYCTVWNPGMQHFTGVSQLQTIGKSLFEIFPSLEKTRFADTFRAVLAGEAVYNREVQASGSPYFVGDGFLECSFAPLFSDAGTIIGGLGVLRDITQRKLAEDEQRKQREHMAAMQEMALRLTSQVELHQLLDDILGRTCLLMETPHTFLALLDAEASVMVVQFASGTFKQTIGRHFELGDRILAAEAWRTRAPVIREHYQELPELGLDRLNGWVIVPLLKGSDALGVIGVAYTDERRHPGEHEVGLLKQFAQLASIGLVNGALTEANVRLEAQATTDQLTGLPNRLLLLGRIEEAKGQTALLMLDLNRFKEVNDTFGHQSGDLLLDQVGQRLREIAGSGTTVARLGGDEFAVFIPGASETDAELLASDIGGAIERPFLIEGCPLHVEASIGIALSPQHGTDPLTLFRHADVAMYTAKRGHKGHAIYDAQLDQYSPRRLALLAELREAIANDGLRLYYQPKAELKTGRVKSVEALVRWQHPTQGFIPPDQFIPLAEQTGLIEPLTQWVLETAMQQCRDWLESGIELGVAVNLSTWNLRDMSLPETIARLLARYQVTPNLLTVEVTESAIMEDKELTLQVLNRLFALGLRVAIDDYGTGYASLAYLKHLPAEELKIDRAFVRHVTSDLADQAIVRSTASMAHSLGIRVVAEGVEDQECWDQLVALKCDIAQGYYLSRPAPACDLERWLGERNTRYALQEDQREEIVLA